MMYMSNTDSNADSNTKTCGCVKWFNKGSGFGFITATDGDRKGQDIFVHHSALVVSKELFRYLVEGEYVTFTWSPSKNNGAESSDRWQAADVTGPNGGKLMCETRNDAQSEVRGHPGSGEGEVRRARPRNPRRFQGGGPRVTDENGVEYRLVRDSNPRSRLDETNLESG